MLKMRLQRFGRKNDPSFRVVVLEATEGPKSGNHVDQIGSYNAITKQKTLNKEKAAYWLSKGVQPSDTVYNFLVTEGVLQGKKKNVLPSKKPIVKDVSTEASAKVEEPKVEAPAVAEAVADEPVAEAPVADEAPVVEETPAPKAAPEAVAAEEVAAPEVVAEPSANEAPAEAPAEEPAA